MKKKAFAYCPSIDELATQVVILWHMGHEEGALQIKNRMERRFGKVPSAEEINAAKKTYDLMTPPAERYVSVDPASPDGDKACAIKWYFGFMLKDPTREHVIIDSIATL